MERKKFELSKGQILSLPKRSKSIVIIRPKSANVGAVKSGNKADARHDEYVLNIEEDSEADIFIIHETDSKIRYTNNIGSNSVVRLFGLWIGEGEGNTVNNLIGRNCCGYDVHMFAQNKNKNFKLDSTLRHANKNTRGNILVKGVVKDSAYTRVNGMIKIEKNGADADSFLTEHIILLNQGARAVANPELEIENNDVTSRHAASVSQIDQEKIFYLMTRGLSREKAVKLIVEGFFEAALDQINDNDKEIKEEMWNKTLAVLEASIN